MDSGIWRPVEQIRPVPVGYAPRLVVYDFDGTISLIRTGWAAEMTGVMVEALEPAGGSADELRAFVYDRVGRTAGQPTLHQMEWLADTVQARGGTTLPAEEYKRIYLQRLGALTQERIAAVETGRLPPGDLLVPGVRDMLAALQARRLVQVLASGTDRVELYRETALLGIRSFFDDEQGDRIYGPDPALPDFTKPWLIGKLLGEGRLPGTALLGFGDGPVEIEAIAAAGGVAVGLITNEHTGKGVDLEKRERLIEAGAHVIIPDYTQLAPILDVVL